MQETQHFAWIDTPAAFDPEIHTVFDEPWKSLAIEGVEGQSAVCNIEVENPQTGLLAAGRPLYAHVALTRDDTVHHLFAGRVVGAPNGLSGDFATLQLDARFGAIDDAIEAAVAPLRITPGWDELFVEPARRDEPMEVLEGYHAHLFVDPRSQAVRISDALVGSAVSTTAATPALGEITLAVPDGLGFAHGVRVRVWYRKDFTEHFTGPITAYAEGSMTVDADAKNGATERADWVISLDITADAIDGESVDMTVDHKPFTVVQTSVEAQWTQSATGDVSLTPAIKAASGRPTIRTLSAPDDFEEAWPEAGAAVNGASGYTVKTASLVKQNSIATSDSILVGWATFASFPINTYTPDLTLSYDLQQKRVETASFALAGNAQALLGDVAQVQILDLRLQDVGPALPSPAHGSFFLSDRGRQALNHALQLARVALAESQRCVNVAATVMGWPLEVIYLTCDHTVCLHSPKLPGGFAIGKVAQFSKRMAEAERGCDLQLKCSVGKGYALTAAGNDNDYVEDGYVEDGYIADGVAVLQTGGADPIAYDSYADQVPDDDLVDIATWSPGRFVQSLSVAPQVEDQTAYLIAHQFLGPNAYQDNTIPSTPEDTLHNNQKTALTMELSSLSTEDALAHAITVTPVGAYGLPKTIDMEAA